MPEWRSSDWVTPPPSRIGTSPLCLAERMTCPLRGLFLAGCLAWTGLINRQRWVRERNSPPTCVKADATNGATARWSESRYVSGHTPTWPATSRGVFFADSPKEWVVGYVDIAAVSAAIFLACAIGFWMGKRDA
jgi:hypothetical protein